MWFSLHFVFSKSNPFFSFVEHFSIGFHLVGWGSNCCWNRNLLILFKCIQCVDYRSFFCSNIIYVCWSFVMNTNKIVCKLCSKMRELWDLCVFARNAWIQNASLKHSLKTYNSFYCGIYIVCQIILLAIICIFIILFSLTAFHDFFCVYLNWITFSHSFKGKKHKSLCNCYHKSWLKYFGLYRR